jgi:rhodanese-related sulfurtransferase
MTLPACTRTILLACTLAATASAPLRADDAAVQAMEAYLDFADYGGGVIFSEQIEPVDYPRFFIIDARQASQFEAGALPGAVNIEWRQALARRHEIPRERPVLIYCHTGMLSAQAAFALRVAGWDNVRVLQGGYLEWLRATAAR